MEYGVGNRFLVLFCIWVSGGRKCCLGTGLKFVVCIEFGVGVCVCVGVFGKCLV